MTLPPDQSAVYRFFTEVGIINQLSSTAVEQVLPGRMTATQFGILGHLARRPEGETPLQLARAFQVPKTTMTHMLAGLVGAGLIAMRANPRDKRSKIAQATQEGGQLLGQTFQELEHQLAPMLAEIGTDDFAAALPHLARIRAAMDKDRDS